MKSIDVKCDKCGQLAFLSGDDIVCIRGNCNGRMKPLTPEKDAVSNFLCSDGLEAGLRDILARNYSASEGSCSWCGEEDYPVDEENKRIEGPNVENADQWHLDHADDCAVTHIEKLLKNEYEFLHKESL